MPELSRDVVATTIPYGQKTKLPKGTSVQITQDLGGSFTVLADIGMMRIEGVDSDALGLDTREAEKPVVNTEPPGDLKTTVTRVWDQLKTCFDPEIPVNIVELGLIYENKVEKIKDSYKVLVKMTLTAPGCGMGSVIQTEAQGKINGIPGIRECEVELVWEPAWDMSKMSDAAKLQLGMM